METERLGQLLQDLPPDLPQRPDRFEQIRRRVHRRRRQRIAAASALTVAMLVAVPVGVQTFSSGPSVTPAGQPDQEPAPGNVHLTPLAEPVTATHVGTATVDLGQRPAQATAVDTAVECLNSGTITYPDGAHIICDANTASSYVLELKPGQDQVRIGASEGASWRITTTYVSTETVPWGVNAKGDTYGAANENGATPDLIYATATNGKLGYVYERDLRTAAGPEPTSPEDALAQQRANEGKSFSIPVYESDGETVIGEFVIQGPSAPVDRPDPSATPTATEPQP